MAKEDEGFRPVFNHADLDGWKTDEKAWKVDGGVLKCGGKSDLRLAARPQKDFELLFDWKGPEAVTLQSEYPKDGGILPWTAEAKKPGEWKRERQTFRTPLLSLAVLPADKLELRNIYVREIKTDKK